MICEKSNMHTWNCASEAVNKWHLRKWSCAANDAIENQESRGVLSFEENKMNNCVIIWSVLEDLQRWQSSGSEIDDLAKDFKKNNAYSWE